MYEMSDIVLYSKVGKSSTSLHTTLNKGNSINDKV